MGRLFRSAFLSVMLLVMALPAFGERENTADKQGSEATITVLDGPVDKSAAQGESSDGSTAAVEITGVRLEETEAGFTLLLETSGELSLPETMVRGNAAISNISNATLNLPEGEDFFASSPAKGIALVTVSALPDSRVQIAVTGADVSPAVSFQVNALGLIASVVVGDVSVQTTDDDAIRLTVTGDQLEDDYFVPNASSATRTNTRILDTPQAIQVVPQQVLEDQQVLRIGEALRNVSGIVAPIDANTSTGASITLRGFSGETSFRSGSVFQDGFRINGTFSTEDTANIEQIEVIKGPSSVLYGQNDPGGIVNLVTKRPLPFPFYEIEVQGGSFGLIRPSFDISGPLTEDGSLAYRLNAAYQSEDGFRDFETQRERFFAAPVLSWDISDRTNLTVLLEYSDETTPYDSGIVALGDGIVEIPRDRIINEPDDFVDNRFLSVGYDLTHEFGEDWMLNHGFRYTNQDYFTVTTLPIGFDEATGEVARFFADREVIFDDYSAQASVVGKFNTGSIQHQLLAGIDYNFNEFDELTNFDTATPTPLNIFDPVYGAVPRSTFAGLAPFPGFDSSTEQIGVFLQDQVTFSDELILVGSLRYDTATERDLSGDTPNQTDQALSPRIGFIYQPVENVSIYASYSQSFLQNSGQAADGSLLGAERGSGYEVGAKAEFLEGDLLATLAYFDITKRNVAATDPNNPFFSIATGEQQSQGVELDLAGEILPGWSVIANYAYTDARITEDSTNPAGNRLFNSPQHSAGLWTTYKIQTGDLKGLGFGLGANYASSRFGDLANSFEIDDYFLTNAALFYERNDWRFGLNLNNLFDVNYISATENSRTFGNQVGTPFSVVGSVSVQF
ncbi:MAG: TonB-dependent siderophore receptor [Cyanobacteria bacterium J06649_5]